MKNDYPKTITLKNDFHNTAATLKVPASGKFSESQIRRAKKTLCGISGCTCGAIRGPQDLKGFTFESWTIR